MKRSKSVAIIGASLADSRIDSIAFDVGKLVAAEGWILLCGGMGGVMEAASKGAFENGGTTVGILPGAEHADGNRYLTVSIPTGLGHARNAVIATAADGLIAIGGGYGTLSEVSLGLKMDKPVLALESWGDIPSVVSVNSPHEAIETLRERLA